MNSLTIMGIIWFVYGLLGRCLGIQNIPDKYKVPSIEKEYKKCNGISWIMQGVSFVILGLLENAVDFNILELILVTIVFSVPAITYSVIFDKKFEKQLKEFNEQ